VEPSPLDHPRYRAAVPPRFRVIRERGRGRSGIVFEAVDETTGQIVAVKITGEPVAPGLLASLQSAPVAGVVRVLGEAHTASGLEIVVMAMVEGAPFVEAIRGTPRPSVAPLLFGQPVRAAGDSVFSPLLASVVPRLRRVVLSLAETLLTLHARGLVHGDVQPDNVLVAADRDHATLIDIDGASFGELYRPLLATATYMSPEQGLRQLRFASDGYGLGVMTFEALTGEVPFSGSAQEVLLKKQTVRAPRPSFLVEGVPDDLDELTIGLLERSPARRTSVEEAVTVLRRAAL